MPRQSKICGLKSCGMRFYRSDTISSGGWSVQGYCSPKHWRMAWREKRRKAKPTFKPKGDGTKARAAINKFLYGAIDPTLVRS